MKSHRSLPALLLIVVASTSGDAGAEVINQDAFTNSTKQKATDFHLMITGTFTANPTSDAFGNITKGGKGSNSADFNSGSVDDGSSMNIKFESTGNMVKPQGYFTPAGDAQHLINSYDANNLIVASLTPGGGYDVALFSSNPFATTLTGTLTVYINTGFAAGFNLNDFDTLRNAQLLTSNLAYSLSPGETAPVLSTHLASADQYLLIFGTADAGDGTGSHQFESALSPVPEPAGLVLLAGGSGAVVVADRRRRRGLDRARRGD